MGKNYAVYLTAEEEKQAKKLIEKGVFPSVYRILQIGLRKLLDAHKN